jgi:hypothetical protein
MAEKVLFEMRVSTDEDGTRVEINVSPEWRDYHRPRRSRPRLFAWADCCGDDDHEREEAHRRPAAADLRRALDSLQSIYDDLYSPAEAG